MSKMLIIPDIHQDIRFLKTIDAKENFSSFDRVILLGDYFDTHKDPAGGTICGVGGTCEYLLSLKEALGDKLIMLLGNHDTAYFEYSIRARTRFSYKGPLYLNCSGFTNSKAQEIHKCFELNAKMKSQDSFWNNFKFYHIEGDTLFTHAGLSRHWISESYHDAPIDINRILAPLDNPAAAIHVQHKLLTAIDRSRGGDNVCGGIIWCDLGEFISTPGVRQVFGHTTFLNRAAMIDESCCIDGSQSIYMTIESNKRTIKTISTERIRCIIEDTTHNTNEDIEINGDLHLD